jgi:hypothetical protein
MSAINTELIISNKDLARLRQEIRNEEYYVPTRLKVDERYYLNEFNEATLNNDKLLNEIICSCITSQGKYILDCMAKRRQVTIANLGTFRIKLHRDTIRDKIKEVELQDISTEDKRKVMVSFVKSLHLSSNALNVNKKVVNNLKKYIHNRK